MTFVLFTYIKKDLIGGIITKNNKQSFKLNVYELNNKTQFEYSFTGHFEKRNVECIKIFETVPLSRGCGCKK